MQVTLRDEAFRQSRRYANAKRGQRPQLPRLCDSAEPTLRERIPDSPFSNYSGIDGVANSANYTTSLDPHPLHTYHALIPTPFLLDFLTIPVLTQSLIVETTAVDLLATLSTLTTL
ncbi:MAG: hypothetical protein F6K65_38010 [Moorea sp. SIO3C2]|nr:hypothetical protein [Moorena sp. SIO3C2]